MNSINFDLTPALLLFVVTIAASVLGLTAFPKLIESCLFRPYWFVRKKQYETIITSGFVHADFMHLLFNMMTFYFFAFKLERIMGAAAFTTLYVLGLVVSEFGTLRKHRNNPEYATLGASGAISAVLFASIVYDPMSSLFIIPIPIPIPAWLFAFGYLAYTYYSARNPHGRINHDAHLGGAITGLIFVALVDPEAYARLLNMF
jgi:membrane associated rhomboid family serine protease